MKKLRIIFLSFMLAITFIAPAIYPSMGNVAVAQAATIKINKKSLTLEVGQSKTLKITGTKKKGTWSSSKKSVATVSSKGKVTAKSKGTATITATVSGKKYTCKVTVKEAVNPYLKDAPFEAKELKVDKISFVIPKNWVTSELSETENAMFGLISEEMNQEEIDSNYTLLTPENTILGSSVLLSIVSTNEKAPDYEDAKEFFNLYLSEDYLKSLIQDVGFGLKVENFKEDEFKTDLSTVFTKSFQLNLGYFNLKTDFKLYCLFIDNYFIAVMTTDAENLNLDSAAEYMMKSVVLR